VAAAFAARGIRAQDRVGVMLGNRVQFATTLLGILRLGAIAVPINTRLQRPEVAYILGQCRARALVHESNLASRVPPRSEAPTVEHILDERHVEGDGEAPALPPIKEEDTAIILYTSGTTGRSKGAMLTHFNIVHSLLHYKYCFALGAGDRAVLAVPASHVTGVVAILLTIWHAQGCAVIMPEFKARDFLELAARERMSYTILVPAMYNLCLLQPDFDRFDLSGWRVGGYGGAPMPEATIATLRRKLPQLGLHNAYGSTETTSPSTLMPAASTAECPDSVGWTVPCGEIIVVDADGRSSRRRDRRAVDPRAHGGSRLLTTRKPRASPSPTAIGARATSVHRPARVRARLRPAERHDQPRRLQGVQRGSGERAQPSSRRPRKRRRRQALPRARRARACLRDAEAARVGRRPEALLRGAPGRLQSA
jgi:acyl-CoA synthetase (AMP-forming)/AMP-acid ligase II